MIPRRPEAGSLTLTLLSVATEGSGAIFDGSFSGVFWLVFRGFRAVLRGFRGSFGLIRGDSGLPGRLPGDSPGQSLAGRRKKSPAHRCAPGRFSWLGSVGNIFEPPATCP
jgi:hypothetical protein